MIPALRDLFFAELRAAGMPEIPGAFSVAPFHQEVPGAILEDIDRFIRVFDRVTTRPAWQDRVTAAAPAIARQRRREVCFFSAWDFHLPSIQPEQWGLIECNDNGSGFLFAALINRLYYEKARTTLVHVREPPPFDVLAAQIAVMIDRETRAFFGGRPRGLLLVLDDDASLQRGKFRAELELLRDLCRRNTWTAEVGAPAELEWSGGQLRWRGEAVAFVVNRVTDFHWRHDDFRSLRAAYEDGNVYVAPNPWTYATRSDKQLLELLSQPRWDAELGIEPDERVVLSARIPTTHLLRDENVDDLARHKDMYVFKPIHGFASHGVLTSAQVGRSRLRRLLGKGEGYVAQRRLPKGRLTAPGGLPVWTDLRVWAYRGERFLISGRASRDPEMLDLSPPGGWLPTYAR